MTNTTPLTHLASAAAQDGADLPTIRALIEEASEAGAAAALRRGVKIPSSGRAAHENQMPGN